MSDLLSEVRAARRAEKQLPSPGKARAIREAADISQARVARELGVHPVTVTRWELGIRRPRGRLLKAYAELLADLQEVLDVHAS